MKTTILLTLLMFFCTTLFSQEEISRKIYLYGNIDSKIQGKTILRFNFQEPKVEKYALSILKDYGIDAVQWTSFFLPGIEYSNDEIVEKLKDNYIENVFYIKLEDVKKGGYGYGTMINSTTAYYTDIELIDLVKLKFEYYQINESISSKPVWIVMGEAQGDSEFSTTKSVMKKIMRRIMQGIYNRGGF